MLCCKPWLTYDRQENQHANLESAVLLSLIPQEKLQLNPFLKYLWKTENNQGHRSGPKRTRPAPNIGHRLTEGSFELLLFNLITFF